MARVWLSFLGTERALSKSAVEQQLKLAGVTVESDDAEWRAGPGIVVFEEVSQSIFDRLRVLSRNGLERVLLVAAQRKALNGPTAWNLLNAGAADVVAWDAVTAPAQEIRARLERWDAVDQLVDSPLVRSHLVGRSPTWIAVLRQIVEIARFTDAAVLIAGETGTGKELAARLIHTLDIRPNKQELVILDCTTIIPELSGSEFFGHERGAFTGAIAARDGAFALADGGTLFLDEVGELPAALQAQLLRIVQEGSFKRVGSNSPQQSHFRLVCATNRELEREISQGRFRADFYYRIASWTCKLPSLAQRREDIVPLALHFIRQYQPHGEPPELDDFVQEYLLTRDYPGNVRDLRRLILRMMHHHVGTGPITLGDIPADERAPMNPANSDWRDEHFENSIQRALFQGANLKEIGRAAEDAAIRRALDHSGGNLRVAAQKLAVTERALQIRRATRRKSQGREL